MDVYSLYGKGSHRYCGSVCGQLF